MPNITYIISDIDKALAFEWIADNLNAQKFRLSFILLNTGDSHLQTYLQQKAIPVTTIRVNNKKDWPAAWWSIYKQLKKHKPDVVHCHLITASLLGLTAAKVAGVKKRIYTRHHSDYHHRYFPKGIKLDKLCNKMATHIIAPSNAVKHVLCNMEAVPPQKVTIIHHGFDLSYFNNISADVIAEMKAKYNPGRQFPVIGVISRFTELKGIQYIIPAFQKLLAIYPDALLLFFGTSGNYQNEIDDLLKNIPQRNYRKIKFENNLAGAYSLFDVFIQASTDTLIESFGQTYVEALAAGVPSIFTLSGIAADFIKHEQNALVVPFKNSDAVYESLITILKDSVLKKRLVDNGKGSVASDFSLHKMIASLEKIYE